MPKNLPEPFPEFNYEGLKRYAKKWRDRYPNINLLNISLYRYDNEYAYRACFSKLFRQINDGYPSILFRRNIQPG